MKSNAAMAQDIKALLYWTITTGNSGKYLSQVNFQPLPSAAVNASEALIESGDLVRAGSHRVQYDWPGVPGARSAPIS